MRLLLVEDNPRLVELLTERIRAACWHVDALGSAAEAAEAMRTEDHDLVLVDLGLPDGNGLDLIRRVRKAGNSVPILIITARGAIEDRINGLDAGADDYLVKPFNHEEFLARCRALTRRRPSGELPDLSIGDLTYRPVDKMLQVGSEGIALSPREVGIVELLMREAGRVVAKRKLEITLSEYDHDLSTNALEQAISRLRKKIETASARVRIETIRGLGYMLKERA
ncbi:MAG: response regulator transcription factor [Alphaproteobacteria bacterium]|nr:response regulator transcription factor [Alphaproteobacteria bacterium]MCB9946197.1 response regulator transcription factor [Rhodospirillaceae bacterium]